VKKCPYCGVDTGDNAKFCPSCGVKLSYTEQGAISSITVSGNDHNEVQSVAETLSKKDKDTHKLEIKLKELESEYELARMGMLKGGFAGGGALVAGLLTLGASLFAFLKKGPGFLNGNQLVIIFGMMIAGLVIYFSFVFGRAARVKMEITKTKKAIEMSSGANVRN
jgi:hypothetical protein